MVVGPHGRKNFLNKMDLKLKGKNALVTGSSQGIGKAIAKILHTEGCNVTLNGRNPKNLKKTALEFQDRIDTCSADVTKINDCKKLIQHTKKQWGSIDILICNVGNGTSVSPGKETFEEWQRVFLTNFYSAVNVIEAAKKELSKTKGTIICISSIAGIETLGGPITYSVAKSALNSYVKNISKPFAKVGIRINGIAPGNIMFKESVWMKKLSKNPRAVKQMLKNDVALGKFGTPDEIASFTAFLCSSQSSFSTGSIFVVDGGQIRS